MSGYNSDLSPRVENNRASDRHNLMRESQDIDQLVMSTFAQNEGMDFQSQQNESSSMMYPGNMQNVTDQIGNSVMQG